MRENRGMDTTTLPAPPADAPAGHARVPLRDLRDRPLPLVLARILAGESGAGSGQFSSSI